MEPQRVFQFLVVLLLILPEKDFSQQQTPRMGQNSPHPLNFLENFQGKKNTKVYANSLLKDRTLYRFTMGALCATPGPVEIIKSNFAVKNLPFFCKQEFQFEKNTSIPLHVRLGSLDYVNQLEGKEARWLGSGY